MSVKLLADENFPAPAIRRLRAQGIDVLSVAEIMPASTDIQVLAFARQDHRWVVTFDRDYGDLVIRHGIAPPPAILYLRQEPYPPEKAADLVLAMAALRERVEGCLVVVTSRHARYRRFLAKQEAASGGRQTSDGNEAE